MWKATNHKKQGNEGKSRSIRTEKVHFGDSQNSLFFFGRSGFQTGCVIKYPIFAFPVLLQPLEVPHAQAPNLRIRLAISFNLHRDGNQYAHEHIYACSYFLEAVESGIETHQLRWFAVGKLGVQSGMVLFRVERANRSFAELQKEVHKGASA